MTMLTCYDPLSSVLPLRNAMNQLLEGSIVSPWSQLFQPVPSIAINVYETDDAFVVKAFAPGLSPEQIQISFEQNNITISGAAQSNTPQNMRVLFNEFQPGSFTRTFSLPLPIDADKVEAKMENGVLFLMLPKIEAAKPRKIQIKTT